MAGEVTITHVGDESWSFQYDFSPAVRSIMLGPKNYLGRGFMATPIAITVSLRAAAAVPR